MYHITDVMCKTGLSRASLREENVLNSSGLLFLYYLFADGIFYIRLYILVVGKKFDLMLGVFSISLAFCVIPFL